MTRTSLNAKGLARRKMSSISNVPSAMGVHNHGEQRRWVGQDPGLPLRRRRATPHLIMRARTRIELSTFQLGSCCLQVDRG